MFEVAEYIGIIAFAISGFFVAVRNKLDLLGILVATFLTALGGGIIRDISVDKVLNHVGEKLNRDIRL